MDSLQQPPLPVDLETAHKELRWWQQEVVRARERVIKFVQQRELDRRSNRGSVLALNEENNRLREEIRLLRARLTEYATKDRS